MKTLYESILDDEEVLIKNTKKDIECPLSVLFHLYNQYGNFEKIDDDDIYDVIKTIGLPNVKNLVLKKGWYGVEIYDQSMTKVTQDPVCSICVSKSRSSFTPSLFTPSLFTRNDFDCIVLNLHDKKSITNKFFGGKKKYDEFCKKMWDWGFAQPNFWRFFYKFEK